MNINSATNSNLLGLQQLQSAVTSTPADTAASTPQALAGSGQSRTQEATALARETQTQQRVQARDEAQASTSSNAAYEQYLQTGRLDTYA
jgi:hypothetical protein